MTFFDEVGKRFDYAVTDVSSRTKEFTAVAKLNSSISAREREIEAAYAQIGKLLFERESADPQSPAAALCAKINANRESINEMRARIVKVREEQKEVRRAKSDELFGDPETVTVDAQDIADEEYACCECCCEEAAEAAETCECCCEEAAKAAEACECCCEEAAEAAETCCKAAEETAGDLSDFYRKPENEG